MSVSDNTIYDSISISGHTYPLSVTFGAENEVNEYLQKMGMETIDALLKDVVDFFGKVTGLVKIKDEIGEDEYNLQSMGLMKSLKTTSISYLLWCLMLTEENIFDLTYEKFKRLTFNIYQDYDKIELANIVLNVFAKGKKENKSSREKKMKHPVTPAAQK